jgi:hypothetical protein
MKKADIEEEQVVVCLGWGSLIWDPRQLPIRSEWYADGPPVRAEFIRKSSDGRITLVLHESVAAVPSLWAIIDTHDPKQARTALGEREGIRPQRHNDLIGLWEPERESPHSTITDLPAWAQARQIKAVVWTRLAHNFHGNNSEQVATSDEIIAYLTNLEGETREKAERYIRNAPKQIDTHIRRRIDTVLGRAGEADG